jgi:hypothetical protein
VVKQLAAENAKLRAALERIASETAATWVSDVAKEALKRQPETGVRNEEGGPRRAAL